jgi:hypothetical protein
VPLDLHDQTDELRNGQGEVAPIRVFAVPHPNPGSRRKSSQLNALLVTDATALTALPPLDDHVCVSK